MEHLFFLLASLGEKASDLPTWLKLFTMLFLALIGLGAYGLHQLPDILREAPPTIRAFREPITKPLNEQTSKPTGVRKRL